MKYLDQQTIRILSRAIDRLLQLLDSEGISIAKDRDFNLYKGIREQHGERHLNQAFDAEFAEFGPRDFCLFTKNENSETIATYCIRRLITDNFYDLIRSQKLWFSKRPRESSQALMLECEEPAIAGEVAHGGGLWVRPDYRGWSHLAFVLPRLARALSFIECPFDHDTGMIRAAAGEEAKLAERKALFAGNRLYGFSRTIRLVNGWFPPAARPAIVHLCHASGNEVLASLMNGIPLSDPACALSTRPAGQPVVNLDGRQPPFFGKYEMNGSSLAVD